ncbi:phospholipase D-like domain-containing protein [Vitiosangium sp. GDMCC 1.1324]|uniref:phospholipase D-like domain-containing protein n=1 Tax=Vitiosangium sp. (strain GDMCC 1.1324) TaxID=2138576 RepID=UPI0018EE7828|nr:phospholipase D-like domain-containing protein [Vitiosangium sp. GDMCC 1.1324]
MSSVTASQGSLTVTAHPGDRAVLLAFDVDADHVKGLAGFSVRVTPQNGQPYWVKNRLGFTSALTSEKGLNDDGNKYIDTDQAPLQMFRWVHFPPTGAGTYRFDVTARYFDDPSTPTLKDGPSVSLQVELRDEEEASVSVGMTRGYVSSQAFIHQYGGNTELWPKNNPTPPLFDTAPYAQKYAFLGAHARELLFGFLDEARQEQADIDMFAYDFNEPDVVRALEQLARSGRTVRVYQDDASLHTGPHAAEPQVLELLKAAGAQTKTGHFKRFSHDKVLILKKGGKAVKVLAGSANFSLRGLYVQANSILVFDDPTVADLYEQAFEQAWTDPTGFPKSDIASKWFDQTLDGSPFSFSFAPHEDPPFSLRKVSDAIQGASSSVLFAVMEMSGSGEVMTTLKDIADDEKVLSLGTIESSGQLKLFRRGDDSSVVSFDYLRQHAPPPFDTEVDAGPGQHIHHKFVVCDFNGPDPVVFCGSSNLSAGGESSNGDNLLAIRDRTIATVYAVEAIRLFDHYNFRSNQTKATASNPMTLARDESWTAGYYDPKHIKCSERQTLIQVQVGPSEQERRETPSTGEEAAPVAKKVPSRVTPSTPPATKTPIAPPVRKATTKKAATKKAAARTTASRRSARTGTAKKATAKKAPSARPARKAATKSAAARKAASRPSARKRPAKKATAKKAPSTRSVRKATAKKAPSRSPVRKSLTRKKTEPASARRATKKVAAKRTTARRTKR